MKILALELCPVRIISNGACYLNLRQKRKQVKNTKNTWLIIISCLLAVTLIASGILNYLQYQKSQELLKTITTLEYEIKNLQNENLLLRAKLIQPIPEIPGVVFTFDDGPFRHFNKANSIEHTQIVLDILKANGIKAAFFIVGSQLDKNVAGKGGTLECYKNCLSREIQEGHTIGIHDYNHIPYWKQSRKQLEKSLDATINKIKENMGINPSVYVRSPGGRISPEVETYLSQRGYKHVYWHIEAEPTNLKSNQYLAHIKSELDKGLRGLILMHDRNASSYLLELIKYLNEKNIKIIPLEEWESKYGMPLTPYQTQSTPWK